MSERNMTTVAIQDVLIPHRELLRDLDACKEAGIVPIKFGLIPFSDEITSDDDLDQNAVPFGSVKLIRLWQQRKTPKGWRVYYDERKFDQRTWMHAVPYAALNNPSMARLATLGAIKNDRWKTAVFVKPTDDLKAFAGMVVEPGETIAERLAQTTQDSRLVDDQPVIWAPRQDIECEFRCWMHDDHLIEASRYRTGLRADHKAVTPEERAILQAVTSEIAEDFAPAMFYVVDIAFMPNGERRVVEYNCINCSGRYEADRGKIFNAII